MVKVPALLLCACVVLSGCTTTVRNRTETRPADPRPFQLTDAPPAHSLPTNYFAPPRLSQLSSNGSNKTPTVAAVHQKERYNGMPRLAGTVVQNSPRSGPRKAKITEPENDAESSGAQTTSGKPAPTLTQSAGAVSKPLAQATLAQMNSVTNSNDSNFLIAVGLLVVLALGTWGSVKFLGYWRNLEPFSSSVGGGIYSDDSHEISSEERFSKTLPGRAESRPKQRWFESNKEYRKRMYLEGKERIVEEPNGSQPNHGLFEKDAQYRHRIAGGANGATVENTTGSGPNQVFLERDEKYREQIANEPDGLIIEGLTSAPGQRFFESDEKYRDRTAQKTNGSTTKEATDSAPKRRFLESDDAYKTRISQEAKNIKASQD